jgi:type I restriction enzyme S subunit
VVTVLPEGWTSATLGKVARWYSGGTPRTSNPDYWNGDIPWISAASLKRFLIRDSDRRVTESGAQNGTRLVPPGTTMFVVRGMSLKTEFRIGITQREVAFGQDCKALIAGPGVDNYFLAYAVAGRRDSILALVDEAGHGTGRLSTDLMQALEIALPPLSEQRQIARFLRTLDARRESCLRVAEANVEAAQALCDAVPVADALSTTFGGFAEIHGGGTPSTKEPSYWNGPVKWATPTDITRLDQPYIWDTERTITDAGLNACSSALHPPGSILMTSRATIGAFAMAQTAMAVNQGFIVVRPRQEHHRWFLFHEMRRRVPEMISRANGSTFMELSRGSFKSMPLIAPPEAALKGLHSTVDLLHRRAAQAMQEQQAIDAFRAEVLPALVCGDVRLNDMHHAEVA